MSTVLEYVDPLEGFRGWLVYDGGSCRIAAGGCRVQQGLTRDTLVSLASRMTLKERLLGINVDGAKCGIDYDPRSPGKAAAVRRFLAFLREELVHRFSMGSDMGTRWDELERLAAAEGIPSIKYAVRRAQEFTDDEFFARLRTLQAPVGALTLAQRRAGHALAEAAVGAARAAGLGPRATCALQGFGNLGRAAACTLAEVGMTVVAVSDEFGCVADHHGLDIPGMLAAPFGTPVQASVRRGEQLPSTALFKIPADISILAATENAISLPQVGELPTPVVVVGANCGLTPDVEAALDRAGVLVIPDFVGGIGGSASVEALFGPEHRPTEVHVLGGVTQIMRQLVDHLISEARRRGTSARSVALHLAQTTIPVPDRRPYGRSRFLA
ncbi:glutamate dehydrogenase/glutamate dehydrogenase (NAD(P)+) [Asanoa hainanensis]|uniref:Glutamate dehydrogenase/glutamate dehydrogenase (NAD(P)+) n=1 Tax=Asanoa hainanensis TaxID=560556 RepID=A0A239P2K0_9ACTN|nr:Glu/Leu/Phe/Val dehydrogenase dimerization domain-containing protein [Asanoa hainanensis]SNT60953.1 glutamate dehydrogenase/glutamate dehydrogenase (NAD(P)+) [Asanoa hainanensis]